MKKCSVFCLFSSIYVLVCNYIDVYMEKVWADRVAHVDACGYIVFSYMIMKCYENIGSLYELMGMDP